jgi:hypothetical protein
MTLSNLVAEKNGAVAGRSEKQILRYAQNDRQKDLQRGWGKELDRGQE